MYDVRFLQACMGQTQLVYKVGWGIVKFIDEILGRVKGLKFFFFLSFLTGLFFYYGVSIGMNG
jgi:hypothetical protein